MSHIVIAHTHVQSTVYNDMIQKTIGHKNSIWGHIMYYLRPDLYVDIRIGIQNVETIMGPKNVMHISF